MHYMHLMDDDEPTPEFPEVKEYLDKGRIKAVKDKVQNIILDVLEHEYDLMLADVNDLVVRHACDRAAKFIDKIMSGDEEAAILALGGGELSRRDIFGAAYPQYCRDGVFKTSGVELREAIIANHKELLVNERIKDLEAIVEGLVNENNRLQRRLEQSH